MSSNQVRPQKRIEKREIIKGFDSKKLKAPFVLRCGALLIDYIVVLFIPVCSLLLGRLLQYDGSRLLNSEIINAGWLITILLCLTNFFIFPMFSGQSIGKMLTGLRIVTSTGQVPGLAQIVLRHVLGYSLTLMSGMIGFLIALIDGRGRSLHDFIAGTVVVYGKSETKVRTALREPKSNTKSKAASPTGSAA